MTNNYVSYPRQSGKNMLRKALNALVAIQELHKPELWVDGFTFHCAECSGTGDTMPTLSPCPTRNLADEALGEVQ